MSFDGIHHLQPRAMQKQQPPQKSTQGKWIDCACSWGYVCTQHKRPITEVYVATDYRPVAIVGEHVRLENVHVSKSESAGSVPSVPHYVVDHDAFDAYRQVRGWLIVFCLTSVASVWIVHALGWLFPHG